MTRAQTHRTADLSYLSRQADAEARVRGEKTPQEWPHFGHYPMGMVEGVPVFDGSRMRPDQVEDAIEELEGYLKLKDRQEDTYSAVKNYLLAYGKSGVRVKDIVEGSGVPRTSVQRYLPKLVEEAFIVMKTEKTRGKGDRRQRYYLADSRTEYKESEVVREDSVTVYTDTDGDAKWDTGIRHHGTGVQGVTCGCGSCTVAFEAALVAELRSKARRRGDRKAAFAAGLEARAMRREADVAAFRAAAGLS